MPQDGIQAAVLQIKLRHLTKGNDLRRTHAERYDSAFSDLAEVVTPFAAPYAKHVYHVYAIRVQNRDDIMRLLQEDGIGCAVHYPIPVHLQAAYAELGKAAGSFPVTEQPRENLFHFRCFPSLRMAQIDEVAARVKRRLRKASFFRNKFFCSMSAPAIATDAFSPTFTVVRNSSSSYSGLSLQTHDPRNGTNWDHLISSHPGSSFFHSTAWANVLSETYGHKPFYLQFLENEKTVALLPFMEINSRLTGRRGVSLPFSDSCEPLLFSDAPSHLVSDRISELAAEREWKYFEVRGESVLFPNTAATMEYFGHELGSAVRLDELCASFPSATRRAIRKAQNAGLTIQAGPRSRGPREIL